MAKNNQELLFIFLTAEWAKLKLNNSQLCLSVWERFKKSFRQLNEPLNLTKKNKPRSNLLRFLEKILGLFGKEVPFFIGAEGR